MTDGSVAHVELEERLGRAGSDVAARLAHVDVTAAVLAAVAAPHGSRRRWPAIAAVAAVLAGTATLAIPSARAGVARWFGVAAGVVEVRIEPFPGDLPVSGAPSFGEPVSAAEAVARTGLAVPAPAVLGAPDAIYVDGSGQRIIAVYAPSAALPAGAVDGVGAIVEVIRGSLDRALFGKYVGAGDVVETEVGGAPALFVSGESHPLTSLDDSGEPIVETARVAGPTLLWDRGLVTFRLESGLDLAAAVTIAESIP